MGWLLALGIGGGLLFLGLGVLFGPFLEGERRPWALMAFAALGLFLAGFGALVGWAASRMVLQEVRGAKKWSFRWDSAEPRRMVTVEAFATLVRSGLADAHGTLRSVHGLELETAPALPQGVDPMVRTFVQCLSRGYALGLVGLNFDRRENWRWEPKNRSAMRDVDLAWEATRESERTILCELVTQRAPAAELQSPLEQLVQLLPMSVARATALRQLWGALKAQPDAELALRRVLTQLTERSIALPDESLEKIQGLLIDELRE
jgi:hypothetical protein